METMMQILARELGRSQRHVENVVSLLDEGNTIPFIARYRKELHGSMDDTTLRALEERLQYLRNLEKRREEIKSAIEGQGKLTDELSAAIDAAATLSEAEDLYRPYKQKRRTRATAAREKGLEPLAALLYAQRPDCPDPLEAAAGYIDPEKGVETAEDALQGASDIIAEDISDDAGVRRVLRTYMLQSRGGQRLPAVLRLPSECQPLAGSSGPGGKPWRAGGVFEGQPDYGPGGRPGSASPRGAAARVPGRGLHQDGGGGRL